MRHAVFGRQLSRTKNERRRLFQGLVRDLILHGAVQTSVAKAKAVQPLVDKLVTLAKRGDDASRRRIFAVVADRKITDLLAAEVSARFAARSSGFTRIVRLGKRRGDASEVVLLQFADERVVEETIAPKQTASPTKPAVKKRQTAQKQKSGKKSQAGAKAKK